MIIDVFVPIRLEIPSFCLYRIVNRIFSGFILIKESENFVLEIFDFLPVVTRSLILRLC